MPPYKCSFSFFSLFMNWASQVVLMVNNPCANVETQEREVPSLGQEDPLGKSVAIHTTSVLAWRISRTGEPGLPQSIVFQSQTQLSDFAHMHILILLNTPFKTQAPESTLAWPKAFHVPSSVTHSWLAMVSRSVALSGILASVLTLKGQNAIFSTCLTTGAYFYEIGIIGSH